MSRHGPPERPTRPGRSDALSVDLTGDTQSVRASRRGREDAMLRRVADDDQLAVGVVPITLGSAFDYRARLVWCLEAGDPMALQQALEALRVQVLADVDRAAVAAWRRWAA